MRGRSRGLGKSSKGKVRRPVPPTKDLDGIPPGPRVPRHLLGTQWLLREHGLIERCRRRYGDVFSLKLWTPGLLIVVCDPTEIKRIFTGDPNLLEAGAGNAFLRRVVGLRSLFVLDGAPHLQTRRLMLPAFHIGRIRAYGDLIDELTDAAIDTWPIDKPFSSLTSMHAITFQVILRAVFGIENVEQRQELERLLPTLVDSPVLTWPLLRRDFGPHSPKGRYISLHEKVSGLLFEEIERRRSEPDLEEREDVLSMLMLARDENGRGMDDGELRDQLLTLLLAGHETTAAALAWTFERLVRNPPVLDRLRNKLAEGDEEYLECAIKESLRCRPVVPAAMRHLAEPTEVGGYTIPAGAIVTASVILTHSRPDLYPEPTAYKPERFLDGGADTYTWIPFGGGVRRCIGATFAIFEMKQILKRVLARCELVAPDSRPERPVRRFVTYQPKRGGRIILRERQPASGTAATPHTDDRVFSTR